MGWEVTAEAFIAELDKLGNDQALDVRINSVGGSVFEGLSIYNRLKMHEGEVAVTIEGLAASMASVIAMAGDTVTMLEASLMMIHNPATSAFGDPDDMRKVADTLDKIKAIILDAYDQRSSLGRDELSAMMDAETWLTPQDALDAGFITAIAALDEDQELDVAASLASLDLSKFERVPFEMLASLGLSKFEEGETIAIEHSADGTYRKSNCPTTQTVQMSFTLIEPDKAPNDKAATTPQPTEVHQMDENEIKAAAKAEALADDKARRNSIQQAFARFPGYDDVLARALDGDDDGGEPMNVEDARAALLDAVAKRQDVEDKDAENGRTHVSVIHDQRDKFTEGMTKSLLARVGIGRDEYSNELRGWSIKDAARQYAILALGESEVYSMTQLQFVGAAFSHSTSDFPNLLENVLNKILLNGYNEAPHTYADWCRVGSVSDFRAHPRLRVGSFNNLDTVLQSGEFKETSIGEEKESITALTKGNLFTVTRQLIINDDMNFLARVAEELGKAARRTVNADLYALLALNSADGPTMSDSTPMFDATHNNLEGTPSAITVASVSAGKAAMRTQQFASTGAGSDAKLDIRADRLVVPVALEDVAKTFVASETDPGQANSKKPNIHRNTLAVVSDPELDDISATGWFLAATTVPNFEVAFLDGVDTPFLDSEEGFTVDGVRWKVRLDYAVGGIEYRGAWRNAGA